MDYCTLFDSNYLDKGLAMLNSLSRVDTKANIYVLCMDDRCYDVLFDISIKNVVLISLRDFEDSELLLVKKHRSRGEYCWTCTAKLIKYVLDNFHSDTCTYVDSDLYFYSDPSILIAEMKSNNCSVQVISHNFPDSIWGRKQARDSGKNCVQFNTFTNEKNSIDLLNKWIRQCINECSVDSVGDQKYISDWEKYDFVNISKNLGAGVAPWNVMRFRWKSGEYNLTDQENRSDYTLVFYHFQNVTNLSRYELVILPLIQCFNVDKKFLRKLYIDYYYELEGYKKSIEDKYDFVPLVTSYISDREGTKTSIMEKIKKNGIRSIYIGLLVIEKKLLKKFRWNEAYVRLERKGDNGNDNAK